MSATRLPPLLLALLPLAALAASPSELYVDRCAHCHQAGVADAPKFGDRAEWTLRVRAGLRLMHQAAIEGIPNTAMSPKGGHRDLADADVRAIVDFMLASSGVDTATLAAARRYDAHGISNRDFIRLDRNLDGVLTRDEVAGDAGLAASFARADENRDGRLSEAEYVKIEQVLEHERAAADVDDAALLAAVQAALATVKDMPPTGIKVEVTRGAVTMSGVVRDAALARDAQHAIRRIRGIRTIDNRLASGHLLSWD